MLLTHSKSQGEGHVNIMKMVKDMENITNAIKYEDAFKGIR